MKRIFALCACLVAATISATAQNTPAFPFTYYIHDTTGQVADTPLPSIYQFSATSLGSNSHVVLKVVNTSSAAAFLSDVFVTSLANSTASNTNFTVTGLAIAISVPAGGSFIFTVNFSPTVTGPITGYMQTSYQVQQNGCDFTSNIVATQCPSGLNVSATLTGSATQPQLVLSYQNSTGSTLLQPSGSPLNFGNISLSATATVTFTLANQSTVPINVPSITLPPEVTTQASPFVLDISNVPSTLAAGASANFTVTFAPGQAILATASLLVGSNIYPLQGEGVVIADVDALHVCYADGVGNQSLPQSGTPIAFNLGFTGENKLSFIITNPATSFNAVTVPAISVTGAGFTLSSIGLNSNPPATTSLCSIPGASTVISGFPVSLGSGSSLVFTITFAPTTYGTSLGSLNIGTRVFALTGLSPTPLLPSLSLSVAPSSVLTSQAQPTVTVELASASPLALSGGLITMSFAPSVTGVADDPTILFLANSGRQLTLSIASGAETATYNDGVSAESALAFQTGTTAGTITFTVTFLNTPTFTQSFTIAPAVVQITSASAVQADPNLVVTVAGYDNTYSAGKLNFTFYNTAGNIIASVPYDATSNFQQLFFNNNTTGGAFSLQATFPVTGDITQVGSVAVTVKNSVGQASTTQTF